MSKKEESNLARIEKHARSFNQREKDSNKNCKLYYFFDAEIFFNYADFRRAIDHTVNNNHYNGFAQLFSFRGLKKEDKNKVRESTIAFGESLIDHIYKLEDSTLKDGNNKPCFILTPEVKEEIMRVLMAKRADILSLNDNFFDSPDKIKRKVEKELTKQRRGNLDNKELAKELIKVVQKLEKDIIKISSDTVILQRYLQIKGRLKNSDYFYDYYEANVSPTRLDKLEYDTYKWRKKVRKIQKRELDEKAENDVLLLAEVEAVNAYFRTKEQEERKENIKRKNSNMPEKHIIHHKALLVTGAARIIDAIKHDDLINYIRTPLSFITDDQFLMQHIYSLGNNGIKILSTAVENIKQAGYLEVDDDLDQTAESWNKFLLERGKITPDKYQPIFKESLNKEFSEDEESVGNILKYIDEIQEKYQSIAQKAFETFAITSIRDFSGLIKESIHPYRSSPPVIWGETFQLERNILKKINQPAINVENIFSYLNENESAFIEQKGGSQYSFITCYALVYSSIGKWRIALQLAKYALSLIDAIKDSDIKNTFHLTGREAQYLEIHAARIVIKNKFRLEELDEKTREYLHSLDNDPCYLAKCPRNKYHILKYRLKSELFASYTKRFLIRVIDDTETYHVELDNRLRGLTDLADNLYNIELLPLEEDELKYTRIALQRKVLTNIFTLLLFSNYRKGEVKQFSLDEKYSDYLEQFHEAITADGKETPKASKLAINTFISANKLLKVISQGKLAKEKITQLSISDDDCTLRYSKKRFDFLEKVIILKN